MLLCAGFLEPRKSWLGLLKSTFNAENFIRSFSMSVSIDFSAICSWNVFRSLKSLKIHKEPLFWRLRSSKVIEFGGNWEPVYEFLLLINYLGPISHHYWDTATYWLKIANFSYPFSFSALVWGDPFRIIAIVFHAADGEDLVILACTVFDWSTCETDGQTDGIAMAKTRWKQ